MPMRGLRRRTPARRVSALLFLAVLVAVQPQVLCGVHCMLLGHPAPMGAPSGQSGHHPAEALCHTHALTGRRSPPAGRLATSWLPVGAATAVPAPVHRFRLPAPSPTRVLAIPMPPTPPPRG